MPEISGMITRDSTSSDWSALLTLYPAAFPEEDLLPLVETLLSGHHPILSLVCEIDGEVCGHCLFTHCALEGGDAELALLGPLAVQPCRQRGGVGTMLVRQGLERLGHHGTARVLVLGDPDYYGRFGFAVDADVLTPCPIPEEWREAWRSIDLRPASGTRLAGRLQVPPPWQRPELWGA